MLAQRSRSSFLRRPPICRARRPIATPRSDRATRPARPTNPRASQLIPQSRARATAARGTPKFQADALGHWTGNHYVTTWLSSAFGRYIEAFVGVSILTSRRLTLHPLQRYLFFDGSRAPFGRLVSRPDRI